MNAAYVLNSQQSRAAGAAREGMCSVPVGDAHSLRVERPLLLRVAQGCAWVTFNEGPYGLGGEAAGDLFLQAGEVLWLGAGRHAVVEPVGPVALQLRLTPVERPKVLHRWWQRAQMGPHGASTCYA
jgi:hypothetical protein